MGRAKKGNSMSKEKDAGLHLAAQFERVTPVTSGQCFPNWVLLNTMSHEKDGVTEVRVSNKDTCGDRVPESGQSEKGDANTNSSPRASASPPHPGHFCGQC